MNNKDQQLLEEAYTYIAQKTAYDERNPKHYEVKLLYKEIVELADQILKDKDLVVWDLTDEDKQKFKAYSRFGLRRVMINKGSPEEYPAFKFGNFWRGEIWGNVLTPDTTTPNSTLKKYADIIEVLKNKLNIHWQELKQRLPELQGMF